MSMTLESSSRAVTVPKYGVGGLQPFLKQNIAKNITLSGKLYVDFYNTRGGYRITFDAIPKADYDNLRAIFQDQLDNEEFLTLTDDDLGIEDLSVWLNLPEEHDLRWNKQAVLGLSITLEPENANS